MTNSVSRQTRVDYSMAHVVPSYSNPMPSSPNLDPSKSRKGLLDDTGFSGVLGRFHGGATLSSQSGSNAMPWVLRSPLMGSNLQRLANQSIRSP